MSKISEQDLARIEAAEEALSPVVKLALTLGSIMCSPPVARLGLALPMTTAFKECGLDKDDPLVDAAFELVINPNPIDIAELIVAAQKVYDATVADATVADATVADATVADATVADAE